MQQRHDQAIVISCRDYREHDRLVLLFTLEHGPLTALARGAKRSQRRFAGALEPYTRIDVTLTIHEAGLSILHAVGNCIVVPALFAQLEHFAHAGYACELATRFLPEHLPNPRLFRLLATYLEQLGANDPLPLVAMRRFFEINLLNILGYRPDLDALTARGDLSPATARQLGRCLATSRFTGVPFPDSTLTEAGRLLDRALASHLDRPLKSLQFLQEIGNLQND